MNTTMIFTSNTRSKSGQLFLVEVDSGKLVASLNWWCDATEANWVKSERDLSQEIDYDECGFQEKKELARIWSRPFDESDPENRRITWRGYDLSRRCCPSCEDFIK